MSTIIARLGRTITRASRLLGLGAATLAALPLVGCYSAERAVFETGAAIGARAQGHVRDYDDVVEFRTRTEIDLVVESSGGNVTIDADESLDRTYVEFVREGRQGFLRGAEAFDSLSRIRWSADLEPGPGPVETLTVRVAIDADEPEPWMVDGHVFIRTPALDRVRVRTERGRVQVRNNRGPVDIETSDGDVVVVTNWPMRDENVVVTSKGDVTWRVRAESNGAYDLATIGGQCDAFVTHGVWRMTDSANGLERMRATLNDGRAPVVIRTTEGDIKVAVVPDPTGTAAFRARP